MFKSNVYIPNYFVFLWLIFRVWTKVSFSFDFFFPFFSFYMFLLLLFQWTINKMSIDNFEVIIKFLWSICMLHFHFVYYHFWCYLFFVVNFYMHLLSIFYCEVLFAFCHVHLLFVLCWEVMCIVSLFIKLKCWPQ